MSNRSAARRLIESRFPLKEASIDSVHEKNVRHGHISTLHVWPARRPLAASRAVLLATLLDDPGGDGRKDLLRRIGGGVVKKESERGEKEETIGGVLHWGRESSPDLTRLRDEIREAFGGRAPRVLDPFAGGGAIPLEAMRLGCEVTASDLNPVAWFILRCTLHYPRLMAGQTRPLPDFALRDRSFVEAFLKAQGIKRKSDLRLHLVRLGHDDGLSARQTSFDVDLPERHADFPWHLRAWGRRVLAGVRRELASYYPIYAEFEPLKRKGRRGKSVLPPKRFKPRPPKLLAPDEEGQVSVDHLNAEFDSLYLEDPCNPRWVAKPAVAYLWARTAECGDCRAEIPLLKTCWLCNRDNKRVLLKVTPRQNRSGVEFGVDCDVPDCRDDDVLGAGTMSESGAKCPCCGGIATMDDLQAQGVAARLGARMMAVVVDGQEGKEYRLPREKEIGATQVGRTEVEACYANIPYGLPDETISPDRPSPNSRGASGLPRYGFKSWEELFSNRQLLALGTIVRRIRGIRVELAEYPREWSESLIAGLACSFSKHADYSSTICSWHKGRETIRNTFARFALPMVWDYCDVNPLSMTSGGLAGMMEWVARYFGHAVVATKLAPSPTVANESAMATTQTKVDLICTDPPYYDAIPYSDLMDFFHVWLRRVSCGLSPETDVVFTCSLGPKWDHGRNDGELVDQPSRFNADGTESRKTYENGMFRTFRRCRDAIEDDGHLVVVFANKQPEAWATLVSALIRAGFLVNASWPIQTEMQNKVAGGARLASSIWIVCKKRSISARAGWDKRVLEEMRQNISDQLREFWDAGIRGPDFVWAATGPALEAYSRHPVVKITDAPGKQLSVAEFLRHVRRMVVGFVVSRLLNPDSGPVDELDDVTTYYLLHRNDFGLQPAPGGASILYALSCNLSDSDLAGRLNILARSRKRRSERDAVDDNEDRTAAPRGGEVRLKAWNQRRGKSLGEPDTNGAQPAVIDCLHKLMQLWKSGDRRQVDRYLEQRGLWRHELFARVTQAVLELAEGGSEERSILESIQNHLRAANISPSRQRTLELGTQSP